MGLPGAILYKAPVERRITSEHHHELLQAAVPSLAARQPHHVWTAPAWLAHYDRRRACNRNGHGVLARSQTGRGPNHRFHRGRRFRVAPGSYRSRGMDLWSQRTAPCFTLHTLIPFLLEGSSYPVNRRKRRIPKEKA